SPRRSSPAARPLRVHVGFCIRLLTPVRTLTVALGERSYPIHIGEGILTRCGELLPPLPSRRAVVVTNPIVAALHLDALRAALSTAGVANEVLQVPDGGAQQDCATRQQAHTRLHE